MQQDIHLDHARPSDGRDSRTGGAVAMVGKSIYAIRWALAPMYLGLWIAMVGYGLHYFLEIFRFAFEMHGWIPAPRENDSSAWLLFILNLIDITMIGNLVVMTTIGGYSTFVKEFDAKGLENKPRWMNGLDSSTLKIKMAMSLAGVSAVHLLKTFIDIGEHPLTDWRPVTFQIGIHMVFLFSMLAFTLNSRFMHASHKPADDHK
jgi:uncharacterized protein (TIGR00645 family)